MQWMQRKKMKKKRMILAISMILILICSMLSPVFAEDEWTDQLLFSEEAASDAEWILPDTIVGYESSGLQEISDDVIEIEEGEEVSDSIEGDPVWPLPEETEIRFDTEETETETEGSLDGTEEQETEDSQEILLEEETEEETERTTEVLEQETEAFIETEEETEYEMEEGIALFSSSDNSLSNPEKVNFDVNFDPSVLPGTPGSGANQWQIMKGSYAGRYDGSSDVNSGFDAASNASYSADNAVRLTKNVISTDKENEFIMYLNVEPLVSWEEILQLNTIIVSGNNRPISPPQMPEGGGKCATFMPYATETHKTAIWFEYYAMENGTKIVLAKIQMYCSTNKVPNGGIGIGNPFLAPKGESFYAHNNFDLDKTPTVQVDISSIYQKFNFSVNKVYLKSVTDQMGDHIIFDAASLNYDGGSYRYEGNVLSWTLPDKDLGTLPYTTETINGVETIIPKGVKRILSNGKLAFYRQETYRLSYRFSLAVEDADFVSCGSADSANDSQAAYAVQTNRSPENSSDSQKGGTVTYTTSGTNGTGYFQSPYVKGLLYNLEFQKVLEKSKIPLQGITFTIKREAGGSSHSEQITLEQEQTSGSDGWVKFHNLPWGTYTLTEVSYKENDSFQNKYLLQEELPKTLGSAVIGQVINAGALTGDHEGIHSADQPGDSKNQLFVYKEGIVENVPYRAKVTIRKIVNSYESLAEDLKSVSYTMKTESSDIYQKPETTDETFESLELLKETGSAAHQQSVTYELIVPREGGTLKLEEIIPDAAKNKVVFSSAVLTENAGSTISGSFTEEENGAVLTVLPGNDLTITVTNLPVGKVYLKKEIADFQSALAGDEFILQAVSVGDGGETVNSQVVLQHGQTSAPIIITEAVSIEITEILPKEYSLSSIQISGGGQIADHQVTVRPGEEVTVTVRNQYTGKPFFHVSDAIKNVFKR